MSLRYYLLTILMFLSSGLVYAQSMDTMLVRVPQSELPLLERNPRLDMLDLYNSQMEAKGENIFGGYSYLLKKTDNYLHIRLTDISEWEALRLNLDGDTVFACIHTVSTPAAESEIHYFTHDWKAEPSVATAVPDFHEFWQPTTDSLSARRCEELREMAQQCPVEFHWQNVEEAPRLSFQISTKGLSVEDQEDLRKCLKPVSGPASQFIRRERP